MSEPYSAFLRLRISRADLARWLAAAPPDVSRWSDWRLIGGQWSLPGGGDLSDPDAPGLQTLISDCNAMLARHPDNRAALEFVLGSAEAENIRIAAYDRHGRHFVAGSLTYSESLYDILFFLALGRSAAEFLATDDAGLVVVHDYLWGEDGERRTVAALGLAGNGHSAFLEPDASGAAAREFDERVEAMLDGQDDPEFFPRDQLEDLRD